MKGDSKKCGRCRKEFVCQVNDITACGCSELTLREATKEYLAKTQYDCLCNICLQELDALIHETNQLDPNQLLQNVHYYIENGLMVFTEAYHISRGYCCKSNCRHCPYGFSLKPKVK